MITEVALGRVLQERRTYEISKIITCYGNCRRMFCSQANAAQDPLMMPEQVSAPMTVSEREVSLAVLAKR